MAASSSFAGLQDVNSTGKPVFVCGRILWHIWRRQRATCGLAPHGAVVSELSGHGSPEPSPLHAAAASGGGSVQGR
jgi:hypothetical protein